MQKTIFFVCCMSCMSRPWLAYALRTVPVTFSKSSLARGRFTFDIVQRMARAKFAGDPILVGSVEIRLLLFADDIAFVASCEDSF